MSGPVSSRRWVRLEAEVVTADDFTRIGGRIVDLGEGGARIEIDERVVAGERLFVSFTLPGVGVIDAEAVVASVENDRQSGSRRVDVELTFTDDTVGAALRGRLSKIPPVLPRSESYDTLPAVTAETG